MTPPNSPSFPSLSQCDNKLRKLPWSVVFYPRVGCCIAGMPVLQEKWISDPLSEIQRLFGECRRREELKICRISGTVNMQSW